MRVFLANLSGCFGVGEPEAHGAGSLLSSSRTLAPSSVLGSACVPRIKAESILYCFSSICLEFGHQIQRGFFF